MHLDTVISLVILLAAFISYVVIAFAVWRQAHVPQSDQESNAAHDEWFLPELAWPY